MPAQAAMAVVAAPTDTREEAAATPTGTATPITTITIRRLT